MVAKSNGRTEPEWSLSSSLHSTTSNELRRQGNDQGTQGGTEPLSFGCIGPRSAVQAALTLALQSRPVYSSPLAASIVYYAQAISLRALGLVRPFTWPPCSSTSRLRSLSLLCVTSPRRFETVLTLISNQGNAARFVLAVRCVHRLTRAQRQQETPHQPQVRPPSPEADSLTLRQTSRARHQG